VPDPTYSLLLGAALVISLIAYVLFGGADFGGGVWDLIATRPRKREQRELIAEAIGPIWEANHVWLILVVVILFSCFPPVFTRLSVALHIPLTLMLVGIVLRGTAFTFRTYDSQDDTVQRRWGALFAVASLVTPIVQGMSAGALIAGALPSQPTGSFADSYLRPWLSAYAVSIGLLVLVLYAFLAAVYLTVEAKDEALREDFRSRALLSGCTLFGTALVALTLSRDAAPQIWTMLLRSGWALPLQGVTGLCAITALGGLWWRRYRLAQAAAAAQVALILTGWAIAQYPYAIPPDLELVASSAPAVTQRLVLGALAAGVVVLVPSLVYLFRIFKRRPSAAQL
jgi:cytochrome d ubiquinol oxidase subunit II